MSRVFITALLLAMIVRVPEAPATVAEQRARLPPAAECESAVEGRWRALIYSKNSVSWYEYTLEIHESATDPSVLSGQMLVHLWTGVPETSEPGPCIDLRMKGRMPATGTFVGGVITFVGGEWETTEVMCGEIPGYNPDTFEGPLDAERQEFQSIHNDGGTAVNDPTVFRRIACFDDVPRKPADVKPPPFYPKRRGSGGC